MKHVFIKTETNMHWDSHSWFQMQFYFHYFLWDLKKKTIEKEQYTKLTISQMYGLQFYCSNDSNNSWAADVLHPLIYGFRKKWTFPVIFVKTAW